MIGEILSPLFDALVSSSGGTRPRLGRTLGRDLAAVTVCGALLTAVLVISIGSADGARWILLAPALPSAYALAAAKGLRRALLASLLASVIVVGVVATWGLLEILGFALSVGG